MMLKNKKSPILIVSGLILILLASVLFTHNVFESNRAGENSKAVLNKINRVIEENTNFEYSEQFINNTLPTTVVECNGYIGKISIQSENLELPIMSSWNYDKLNISPCVFNGSVYENNLVIAGHNYASHFGNLKNLATGSKVVFTDINNNSLNYVVSNIEYLQPNQTDEMTTKTENDNWDLTLFTCTFDGSKRCTVRCQKIDS